MESLRLSVTAIAGGGIELSIEACLACLVGTRDTIPSIIPVLVASRESRGLPCRNLDLGRRAFPASRTRGLTMFRPAQAAPPPGQGSSSLLDGLRNHRLEGSVVADEVDCRW